MLSKYGNCHASAENYKQAENLLYLQIKSGRILDILWVFFNKTVIALVLVGYEMITANSYPTRTGGIIVN